MKLSGRFGRDARTNLLIGLIAGVVATLAWALYFIVPFVIGDYSIFDFALFQYVTSGILSVTFLASNAKVVRTLPLRDWRMAFSLGLIGYLGYFLSLTGAAIYAGPVIAPAFLGLVPVVLAIAGNLRQRTLAWKKLALPLTVAAAGLLLVNGSSFGHAGAIELRSLTIGVPLAILAVTLWTCFGLLNQAALASRPTMKAGIWTALIMTGASLWMLAFLPIGLMLGVFDIPRLGLQWEVAAPLYICAAAASILVNLGGTLAWTIASQRLPLVLAAQLITLEPTFGAVFGLLVHHTLPRWAEAAGITLLLVGVVIAIRVFYGRQETELKPEAA
jgi:drug/metabolite transporter (DMT)-like permease